MEADYKYEDCLDEGGDPLSLKRGLDDDARAWAAMLYLRQVFMDDKAAEGVAHAHLLKVFRIMREEERANHDRPPRLE